MTLKHSKFVLDLIARNNKVATKSIQVCYIHTKTSLNKTILNNKCNALRRVILRKLRLIISRATYIVVAQLI